MNVIEKFEAIKIESPVEKIINQIRNSIVSGQLLPGQKLPSERQLSERFGIGRTFVREAIKRLEVFGILKTHPQSGTIITGIDISAIDGYFGKVIKLSNDDFVHLVETRILIEKFACRQAASRCTNSDIKAIADALSKYQNKVDADLPAEHEDFVFHLAIADACHNPFVKSMMLVIIPDISAIYRNLNVCDATRAQKTLTEHTRIFHSIQNRKPDEAEAEMAIHLKDVENFSLTYKANFI